MLATLAVVLILLGALGAGFAAMQMGAKNEYLSFRTDVDAGTRITSDMLGRVTMAGYSTNLIPAENADSVLNAYTRTKVSRGDVVLSSNLTSAQPIPPNGAQIVVNLKTSLAPSGRSGDRVIVVDAQQSPDGRQLIAVAQIVSVIQRAAGGASAQAAGTNTSSSVVLLVNKADAAKVMRANHEDDVALALLNPSTELNPEIGGN